MTELAGPMSFHPLELPIRDPVLFFALVTAVFFVVPLLFERAGVPGLIGLIIVGAAIGPYGAGLLPRDAAMELLGTVGLLYLMFLVGLELDLKQFRRQRQHSLVFGIASFALPQLTGIAVSRALGYGVEASILLGAMFASHTLVAYPIASRFGIVRTGAVTTVLGATLITDVLALLVLAVVIGAHAGGVGLGFWVALCASLAGLGAVILWLVPRVARWFFRRMSGGDGAREFVFVMVVLFGCCSMARLVGIEPIIAALLTGLALNRFIPQQSALMSRIRFSGSALLIPFFLISVGMLVDVRAFGRSEAWAAIAALTLSVLGSKAVAAKLTQRLFGYAPEDGWVMFGMSVSHAAATMAIVLVGYNVGLLDREVLNAVVVIILVTCLVGPWAVNRWGRILALREEARPYDPGHGSGRVLIPISHPKSRDALLDLGMLLRERGSQEPLLPLMVVRDDGDAEAKVAEAERMLGAAVMRASAAAVPVTPLTRVDQNVASGISRAVAETRASTVVIGWEGGRPVPETAVFGGVLDQLLEASKGQVIVARLTRPLNAVSRVLLILPPFANRHPGFASAARTVKTLAGELAAPLRLLVIGDRTEPFEKALAGLRPDVDVEVAPPIGWRDLEGELEATMRDDDLLVLIGARHGTLPWHPRLQRLPRVLVGAGAGIPLLVLYPPEQDRTTAEVEAAGAASGGGRGIDVFDYLAPHRIVADMARLPFDRALEQLLACETDLSVSTRETILSALTRTALEDSFELKPHVALPHVRVEGVGRPMLFLAMAREGIDFPHSTEPARVIFLLVSPVESPDDHLRALSAVARLCSDDVRLEDLQKRLDPRRKIIGTT
jgi:Kef-type K+ transport system membrane component KefB/mannitol/fructose-specific phosphotransferase system IIA component (Ntr-type)